MNNTAELSLLESISANEEESPIDVNSNKEKDGGDTNKKFVCDAKFKESVFIIIAFSAQGLNAALIGPTLQDLRFITNSSTEEISRVLTGNFVGQMCGSLVATYAYVKISYTLMVFMCLTLSAATMASIPWCPNVGVMSVAFALKGFSEGLLLTGLNLALMWIWGRKNGPYTQASYSLQALGSLIAPLLAKPFLMRPNQQHDTNSTSSQLNCIVQNTSSNCTVSLVQNLTGENETVTYQSEVYIIYSIIAGWSALWAVVFFIQAIQSGKLAVKPKPRDEQAVQIPAQRRVALFYINRIAIIVFGFLHGCIISTLPNYLSSFVMEYLSWTSSSGAVLTSVFWMTLCVGRAICIPIVRCFSPATTILSSLTVLSVFLIVFTLLNQMESGIVWASVAFIGISVGPLAPAALSWYVKETSSLSSIISGGINASGGLGGSLTPLLIGYLFDNVTPMWFCYLQTGGSITMFLLFASLTVGKYILRKKHNAYSTIPGNVYN